MSDDRPPEGQVSSSVPPRETKTSSTGKDGPGWAAIGVWVAILVAVVGFGYKQSERLTRIEEAIAGERGLNYRMEQVESGLDTLATRVEDLDSRVGSVNDAVRDHTAALGEVRATVARTLGSVETGPAIREPQSEPGE